MAQSVIHLTQSRYFSPVFNAAVFDGPIRIYFAQHQEAMALQVYFRLQQYMKETYSTLRKTFKQHGQTVFLMLYPNLESFESSFANSFAGVSAISAGASSQNNSPLANVVSERLGDDFVLGVRGPLADDQFDEIFIAVKSILQVPQSTLPPNPERALL